ncbi:hypothetical protein ACGFIO_43035, partial [Actinoplanes sp. NPDC049265]
MVRIDKNGRAELVRMSAESMMKGPGRRLGDLDGSTEAPPVARPAEGVDGFTYFEAGPDGSPVPTQLRPGEVVLNSEPASGTGKNDAGRYLEFDPQSKTFSVREIDRVAPSDPPKNAEPQEHQLLRRNPDGSIDLLTLKERPTVGEPRPTADGSQYHELNARNPRDWHDQELGFSQKPKVERLSAPQTPRTPGRRLGDGEVVRYDVVWEREPTSVLARHQETGKWELLHKTEGSWSIKGDPAAGRSTPGLRPTRGPSDVASPSSTHYRVNSQTKELEPVAMRPNDLDIAEVGVQTGRVRFDQYTPDGGPGGGKPNYKLQPDGTLAADNIKKLGARDLTYDPKTGEINYGGARPKGDGPGGPADGKPSSGSDGTATKGAGRGSEIQLDDSVKFLPKSRLGDQTSFPTGPPAKRPSLPEADAARPGRGPARNGSGGGGADGGFRDPDGGGRTMLDEGVVPAVPDAGRASSPAGASHPAPAAGRGDAPGPSNTPSSRGASVPAVNPASGQSPDQGGTPAPGGSPDRPGTPASHGSNRQSGTPADAKPTSTPGAKAPVLKLRQQITTMESSSGSRGSDVAAQLRRPVPDVPDASYGERQVLVGLGDGERLSWPH